MFLTARLLLAVSTPKDSHCGMVSAFQTSVLTLVYAFKRVLQYDLNICRYCQEGCVL